MKKKRIIPLFVSLITAASLIGCGADGHKTLETYKESTAEEVNSVCEQTESGEEEYDPYHFRTPPQSDSYLSGRIVVGDSRCCQLGMYQVKEGLSEFAAFAVWGGSYIAGRINPIMTDELVSKVRECFEAQINRRGKSTVFFFATVNDYDFAGNGNATSVAAAISAAEELASMTCEKDGTAYSPKIVVIGFEGCAKDADLSGTVSAGDFNRYVADYNDKLKEAVNESAILTSAGARFTTVKEIVGDDAEFIEDNIHYGDGTLKAITDYIASCE